MIADNRFQQKLSQCLSGINDSRDVLTASENNHAGDDDYEAQAESGSMNSSSYMSLKRNQQRLKKKDTSKTIKRKLDESLSNNAEQFSFYQQNPAASDEHQTTFHVEGGHKELSQSPEMGCTRN